MKLLAGIALLGMIDSIHGDYVTSEISGSDGVVEVLEIPTFLFPCKVKEGDFFYIVEIDGVTEIRCGEPDV